MQIETLDIKFTLDQVLELFKQLPDAVKQELINSWTKELQVLSAPDLNMDHWEEDIDLEEYAVQEATLSPMRELWAEAPDAVELSSFIKP